MARFSASSSARHGSRAAAGVSRVYLDYAGFSPVDPRVLAVMRPFLEGGIGNPAAPHSLGLEARDSLDGARVKVARLFGGAPAGEKLMNYFARKDTPMELAVSLGSAISYIQHPASMTHAVVPEADRVLRGITPGLIRLSVGLEGADVLIDHLDRGLTLAHETS